MFEYKEEGEERVGDWTDFFTLDRRDECGNYACSVLAEDCFGPLVSDQVEFRSTNPRAIFASTNVPGGYTFNFCYSCTVRSAQVTSSI